MLLTTSPRGLSELLGGGVPSSDIDHSRPRIRRLLSHILLIEPATTSLTAVLLPSGGGIALLTRRPIHGHVSTRYHPSNRASPVSISAHQKPLPSSPSLVTSRVRFLLPSLTFTPAMPAKFLLPPLPCCRRNIF